MKHVQFTDQDFNSVLEPIPTTGMTIADVETLSTRVREMMLKEIKDIGAGGRIVEDSKSK